MTQSLDHAAALVDQFIYEVKEFQCLQVCTVLLIGYRIAGKFGGH